MWPYWDPDFRISNLQNYEEYISVDNLKKKKKTKKLQLIRTLFVQSLRSVQLFSTPWTTARQASLSFAVSWSLLKLMCIESVMPSNHLILCHPFSFCPQSFPASESFPVSQIFAPGGQSIGASAAASYSGLISFRVD